MPPSLDQGIGAKVHDALAGLGEIDHEGKYFAAASDHHFSRLAAREIDDVGRDEIIDHDDIGGLQRAHRAQRQELRVCGSRIQERDGAALRGACLRARVAHKGVEIALSRLAIAMRDGVRGEQPPEGAPRSERQSRSLHCLAPTPGGSCPAGKTSRDHGFEPGADRLGKNRRRAVGGDPDDQGRAVDDRAECKVAVSGLVDDVDCDASRKGSAPEPLRLVLVIEVADTQRGSNHVGNPPGPTLERDCPARRLRCDGAKLFARMRGEHIDVGAGSGQELRLPRGRRPIARDQDALAFERQKDRKPGEWLHARGLHLRCTAMDDGIKHQYTSCW
jgi:hypothetical protein